MTSCKDCPSFLKPEQMPNRYGRSIGSPVCGRFGTVLGKADFTNQQERGLQERMANACPEYGNPMPPTSDRDMYVMLPIVELRDSSKIIPAKMSGCTSCAMCSNFVSESAVVNETGWTSGMCAARGKLILSNRMSQEASGCEYRQFGATRSSTGGMHFLPDYEPGAFTNAVNPTQAYFKAKREPVIDPSEYPTDKEVSPGEEAAGIRAWRKVEDPEGTGNAIFFPVYDASFFDDEDRALIPKTGSEEHPELYLDHFGGLYGLMVAWIELDETPVFWGMPGVGKTELLRYAAWNMQIPFRRLSFYATSEVDDTFGKYEYSAEKGTWFRPGRLTIGWTVPGVLCLDEPNTAPPEVWQRIRPLTDNSKQLVLDEFDGKPLDRNDDCYMGMCMNPAWDPRNVGAMEIADADANRVFHTYIELPPPILEREIIQSRVRLDGWELTEVQLNALMDTATDLRKLSEADQLPVTWAIRQQIKVARALKWFKPVTAYRRAAGDYLNPEALQIMLDQVRAHFTDEGN